MKFMSAHGSASGIVALGVVALVGVVGLTRRWQSRRYELRWLEQRLAVPKRPASPHLVRKPIRQERRQYPRRHGNPVAIVLFDWSDSEKIGEGWVVDRCMGGICISSANRIPVGSHLQLRPMTQRNTLPSVPVEVRNVRPDPMAWRLGCRFLRQPSWSVLMHLR